LYTVNSEILQRRFVVETNKFSEGRVRAKFLIGINGEYIGRQNVEEYTEKGNNQFNDLKGELKAGHVRFENEGGCGEEVYEEVK